MHMLADKETMGVVSGHSQGFVVVVEVPVVEVPVVEVPVVEEPVVEEPVVYVLVVVVVTEVNEDVGVAEAQVSRVSVLSVTSMDTGVVNARDSPIVMTVMNLYLLRRRKPHLPGFWIVELVRI
ncbi:hypothetical protein GN958_ATG16556 [Phytophthora infestans]|uniref:Uncharacterized protein n=1 Tax=Phytophthora infestans TaxID=4787 RepID=A0A8S9U025_PHYIN|nr:hypothetical protein GN958_ATG16556 [Phytophthora infestans]